MALPHGRGGLAHQPWAELTRVQFLPPIAWPDPHLMVAEIPTP
jgi:hypothetical protein